MSNIIQISLLFILIINIVSSSTLSFRHKKKLRTSRLLSFKEEEQRPDCQPEYISKDVIFKYNDEDYFLATHQYLVDHYWNDYNETLEVTLFKREVNMNTYKAVEDPDFDHLHIQKCIDKNLICMWEGEEEFVPYSDSTSFFECFNVTKIDEDRETSCVNHVNTFCTYEDASDIADALTEMKQKHCAE